MLPYFILDLVKLLLGDIGSNLVSDLSFDIPKIPRDINKIQALKDNSIITPNPRRGCAIGWEASNSLSKPGESVPFIANTNTIPLEISDFGSHKYGGPTSIVPGSDKFISDDKIGHIYTKYGGIIDLAHLRDHADITRYIATKVVSLFNSGGKFSLGDDTDPGRDDTGDRVITIKPQGKDPSAYQAAVLGAMISYEVAVWHEITTYKTMQDYSTFSPEDNYSNLLGAYIGFIACLNEIESYEAAVTNIIIRKIMLLSPQSKNITFKIVDYLKDKWYKYSDSILEETFKPKHKSPAYFPDIYLQVLRRHCDTGYNESLIDRTKPSFYVSPWLATDASKTLTTEIRSAISSIPPSYQRVSIKIPTVDENNVTLRQYYSFEITNAANKDETLFDSLLINGTLDSTKFGQLAEVIRQKYQYEFGFDTDKPAIQY